MGVDEKDISMSRLAIVNLCLMDGINAYSNDINGMETPEFPNDVWPAWADNAARAIVGLFFKQRLKECYFLLEDFFDKNVFEWIDCNRFDDGFDLDKKNRILAGFMAVYDLFGDLSKMYFRPDQMNGFKRCFGIYKKIFDKEK